MRGLLDDFKFRFRAITTYCNATRPLPRTAHIGNRQAISVQTTKSGTQSIKLVNNADLFPVTTADISAIQAGKFVGITSVERVAREVYVFDESRGGTIPGILNPSRT